MPIWINDAVNWLTEYWIWVAAGFALLADIIGALEMAGVAYAKGYSRAKYFIICFFFTLLGYFVVIALPDVETAERNEEILETLHRINGKLARVNTGIKKLNAPAKQRLPEAVKRLAVPTPASASRTHDTVPGRGAEFAAPAAAVAKATAEASSPATSAHELLETVLQFETETGMVNYFRRKYEKADDATKAALESLTHISDERFRQAAEKMLNRV